MKDAQQDYSTPSSTLLKFNETTTPGKLWFCVHCTVFNEIIKKNPIYCKWIKYILYL